MVRISAGIDISHIRSLALIFILGRGRLRLVYPQLCRHCLTRGHAPGLQDHFLIHVCHADSVQLFFEQEKVSEHPGRDPCNCVLCHSDHSLQFCLAIIWKFNNRLVHLHSQRRIVLWCKGSTTDFGSVSLGSNPGRTTMKTPVILGLFVFHFKRNLLLSSPAGQ